MSEKDLRHEFGLKLRPFGIVQDIESPMESGIPDECCLLRYPHRMETIRYHLGKAHTDDGKLMTFDQVDRMVLPESAVPEWRAKTSWVELKHAYRWPQRGGPLRFEHFTTEQKLWLTSWARTGGRCCLLAKVGDDYALIPPAHLQELHEQGMTRERARTIAEVWNSVAFPTKRVLRWLTS